MRNESWDIYVFSKPPTIEQLSNSWDWIIAKQKAEIIQASGERFLHFMIAKATSLQERGKFAQSAKEYLKIIEREGKLYPELLDEMFKPVLCLGAVDLAYEIISEAEVIAKQVWGPRPTRGACKEWPQEAHRKKLEHALFESLLYVGHPEERPSKTSTIVLALMQTYSKGHAVVLPSDYMKRVDTAISRMMEWENTRFMLALKRSADAL